MSKFTLKVLWLENNIAIAIDQIVGNGTSPLTSYFFWPRNDAWEELKAELESKPWIAERDRIEFIKQKQQKLSITGKKKGKNTL